MNSENALNVENFETFLIGSLFPNNEVNLGNLNVNFDFFEEKEDKDTWYRIPYYVFDYVSMLNK